MSLERSMLAIATVGYLADESDRRFRCPPNRVLMPWAQCIVMEGARWRAREAGNLDVSQLLAAELEKWNGWILARWAMEPRWWEPFFD